VTVVNTELILSIPQKREISSPVKRLSAYQESGFIIFLSFYGQTYLNHRLQSDAHPFLSIAC
jgi:hypothetical protein